MKPEEAIAALSGQFVLGPIETRTPRDQTVVVVRGFEVGSAPVQPVLIFRDARLRMVQLVWTQAPFPSDITLALEAKYGAPAKVSGPGITIQGDFIKSG